MINLREQYWAVEVPEDFTMANIWNNQVCSGELVLFPLPAGNWGIVCTSKKVTEKQAAGIVDKDNRGYKHYWEDKGFTPRGFNGRYKTAIESFHSLLTSKGCDLNKTYLIIKKVA